MIGLLAIALAQEPGVHDVSGVRCGHCHDDPHAAVAPACARCHTPLAWVPTRFTVEDHLRVAFPLEGRHVEVPCAECHVDAVLSPLPTACNGCHVDRHRGILGTDCAACHSVEGFTPVEGFDHAERTGFPLTGPHAAPPCAACHDGSRGAAMRQASPVTCGTCHTPDHGPFAGRPCETCHDPAHGTFTGGPSFDHGATGFPLERRHRIQRCPACHPVGPDPVSRCATCHVDPHGGEMTLRCEDCHRPDRWRLARFDHDTTGWPLRGRHFVTACGVCHTNQRWIGLPQACADCHAFDAARGDPANPAHAVPSRCDDCHVSTWSWSFR